MFVPFGQDITSFDDGVLLSALQPTRSDYSIEAGRTPLLEFEALLLLALPFVFTFAKFVELLTFGERSHHHAAVTGYTLYQRLYALILCIISCIAALCLAASLLSSSAMRFCARSPSFFFHEADIYFMSNTKLDQC